MQRRHGTGHKSVGAKGTRGNGGDTQVRAFCLRHRESLHSGAISGGGKAQGASRREDIRDADGKEHEDAGGVGSREGEVEGEGPEERIERWKGKLRYGCVMIGMPMASLRRHQSLDILSECCYAVVEVALCLPSDLDAFQLLAQE